MHSYQMRVSDKQARLVTRAQKLAQEATGLHSQARRMASIIPFGQPILIGHHSEGRDRRYRTRIANTFEKSYKVSQAAANAAARAENYGSGGIASDNPDAIRLLEDKIAKLEATQLKMKTANAIIRKGVDVAAKLAVIGVPLEITKPDFCGRIGFASYQLTNNNANIRQAKKRIEELRRLEVKVEAAPAIDHEAFSIVQDADEGRILVTFAAGKPSETVRVIMKRGGYVWSPSRSAWVRKITLNAVCALEHTLIKQLTKAFSGDVA